MREHYRSSPLRPRLELLAFDARLAGAPPALLEALWEAMDSLDSDTNAPPRGEAS